MDKIIAYELGGRTFVVHPAPQARMKAENERALLDHIIKKNVPPDATNVSIRALADLPADRTFRDAWKHDLSVDMMRAREIHRDKLRRIRQPLLTELDVAYMRADEAGVSVLKADISNRKQGLRDVTKHPLIEVARTPDDLKQAIPDILK